MRVISVHLLLILVLSVVGTAVAQDFGMTGIVLGADGELRRASAVLPHSPAADAGIAKGDTILAVDGVGTTDLTLNEIVAKIRGKPGTEVSLIVMSHETGVAFCYTLKRVSSSAFQIANP